MKTVDSVLEAFSTDIATPIVKDIISHLMSLQKFDDYLKTEEDINFNIEFLLYALKTDMAKSAVDIFSKWLVPPTSPNALLDSSRFNFYIRIFFQHIPFVFSNHNLSEDDKIGATQAINSFLDFYLTLIKSDTLSAKQLFETQTWSVILEAILFSIEGAYSVDAGKIILPYYYFVNAFITAQLYQEGETKKLLFKFFDLTVCRTTQSNFFTDLSKKVISLFIRPSTPEESKFAALVIADLQEVAKSQSPQLFKITCDILFDTYQESIQNEIISPPFPLSPLLRFMGSCAFTIPNPESLESHLQYLFKVFSLGFSGKNNSEITPENPVHENNSGSTKDNKHSKWDEVFVKYIRFLLSTPNSISVAKTILTSTASFVAERPNLVGRFLVNLLAKAVALKEDLNSQSWIPFFESLIALLGRNSDQGHSIIVIAPLIDKFTMTGKRLYPDFTLHEIALDATAGIFSFFDNHLSGFFNNLICGGDEDGADLVLYFFGIAPSYLSNSPSFENSSATVQPIEAAIKWLEKYALPNFRNQQKISENYLIAFLLCIVELAQRSKIFDSNCGRRAIQHLSSFLSLLETSSPDPRSDFSLLLLLAKRSVLSRISLFSEQDQISPQICENFNNQTQNHTQNGNKNQISKEGKNQISNESKNGETWGFKESVVSLYENVLVMREPTGAIVFDVEEQTPTKTAPNEESLKPHFVHWSDLQNIETVPFAPIEMPPPRPHPLQFMIDSGFSILLRPLSYEKPEFHNLISQYDSLGTTTIYKSLSNSVPLSVGLTFVSLSSNSLFSQNIQNSIEFRKFQRDLGERTNTATCDVEYKTLEKEEETDILIVFNSGQGKLNGFENCRANMVIEVRKQTEGLWDSLAQKVMNSEEFYYIVEIRKAPLKYHFPIEKNQCILFERSKLKTIVGSLVYFYAAQTMVATSPGNEMNLIAMSSVKRIRERMRILKELNKFTQ